MSGQNDYLRQKDQQMMINRDAERTAGEAADSRAKKAIAGSTEGTAMAAGAQFDLGQSIKALGLDRSDTAEQMQDW